MYKFDHVYPGTANKDVVAALYGELGKPGFSELHEKLKSLSKQKKVTYVLRHFVKVTGFCMNCYSLRELQKKPTKIKNLVCICSDNDRIMQHAGFRKSHR